MLFFARVLDGHHGDLGRQDKGFGSGEWPSALPAVQSAIVERWVATGESRRL
jgi:hypothetical protein